MINLSERLSMVAAMVVESSDPACKYIDIGTDHAYLPVFLIQSKKADKVIATEIAKKPLENARKTVARYKLSERIDLVLTNGLKNIDTSGKCEIIISGMGGTLIAEILSVAENIRHEDIHLVLQPQSHAFDVREWLCKNGFQIEYESVCEDDGKIYHAISAYYKNDYTKADDVGYFYFGELKNIKDEKAKYLINKQLKVINNRIKGLTESGRNPEELERMLLAVKGFKING